ncbi:hypothetical protein MNBD_IGNAVI01-1967 [hydrothermal vent metagenome]|uniref:Neutral/alkaline non-lysosomal ceramidase N-terminal domain-containing protein n=1 Tax=hydrothermal vent metagenome TaxID=652676 RepID=A0A3B1C312_9ZZZZ
MYKMFMFILTLAALTLSIHAQQLKVGASYKNITPNPLLPVSGGVGIPKPSNIKWGELTTRALVLTKGDTKVAIVSIDNLGVPKLIGDRIRTLVPEIKPKNIIIGVTHTHSAPDVYGFADEKGNTGTDLKYIDFLVKQTAAAINEAYKSIKPANVKIAVGKAKGKIAYNAYAPKLYDPRCGVMQFISTDNNKVISTLVNYAIHPEVVGNSQGVTTPDLIGPLYDKIESKVGGMAIFMNSAQGGMVTADNRRNNGKEVKDWNECIRIGELLANEALRIISGAEVQKDPQIFIASKDFDLPVDSDLMKFVLNHTILNYNMPNSETVSTRMNLVNIGNAQVITIPGEALPNIGFYIKRKMRTKNPFIFGLTNDAYGYILTKEDFNSFERYNYITRTSLGERTEGIIVNEAMELIKESPSAE